MIKKTPFDKEVKIAVHPGLTLLKDNGCTSCHTLDGSALVGPSYKDMFGRKVKVKVDGSLKEILTDENYLKRAILEPDAEIVDGYSGGMMSSYKDIISDEDIDKIIDYFKGGKVEVKIDKKAEAMAILDNNGCTGCHSLDGSALVGPSYQDMFGRKVKVTVNGSLKEILTDENYLKRAILEPDGEIVDGYSGGMMSSYKGIISDEDIDKIINYFKGDKVEVKVEPKVKVKVKEPVDNKTKAMSILNKNGCKACHSLDGSARVGPSYKGMFGRTVKVKIGDSLKEILSDEDYLKRAILEPNAEVVDGFNGGMMRSYKGVLSDKDIDSLIEYFKGL